MVPARHRTIVPRRMDRDQLSKLPEKGIDKARRVCYNIISGGEQPPEVERKDKPMIVAKNGPMVLTLEAGQMEPDWHIYDTMEEVDAAIESARAAGARIVSPGAMVATVDKIARKARAYNRARARRLVG